MTTPPARSCPPGAGNEPAVIPGKPVRRALTLCTVKPSPSDDGRPQMNSTSSMATTAQAPPTAAPKMSGLSRDDSTSTPLSR